MTLMSKDTVTTNKHNTAICVRAESDSTGDLSALFPEYFAVRGDARNDAEALLLEQRQHMRRSYLRKLAVTSGLALCLMIFLAANHQYLVGEFLVLAAFAAVTAVIFPLCITSGSIAAEDLRINDTVYRNLTADDRDALFQAQAESPDVLKAAVKILSERYSADESRRRIEKQQQDQARAATILVAHEPLT